jgi:hypothetical protein
LRSAPVKIVEGEPMGREYQIAFNIDAHHRPDVCSHYALPFVALPEFRSPISQAEE